MQPHDVWWVCEFCQVRLQGEVRKMLHKTSTFSPCSRNWLKRLKEQVTLLEQAQQQQQEEQQEHIAMIVSSSSSSSSSSSGSGSAAAGREEDEPMVIRSYRVISNTSILHISSTLSLSDSCTVDPLIFCSRPSVFPN